MIEQISSKFREFSKENTFKRIDSSHILDIYIGFDLSSRPTLLLITNNEPTAIMSSQLIDISIGKRNDLKWALSFSLTNKMYEELFFYFCTDIVESSRNLKIVEEGSMFVCNRYQKWQKMLLKTKGDLLSFSEIKGLIGELIFLRDNLFTKIGQDKAINSWIGPEKADQDFVFENTWWEVKSTTLGTDRVTISSIEQLDTINEGTLIIVYLEKTSFEDSQKLSLNSIISEISEEIIEFELRDKFMEILLQFGYSFRKEYDDIVFKFHGFEEYLVNSEFPCIRRISTPNAVISAKYDLLIPQINEFILNRD